jgi:hypothetical protein
MAAAPLYLIERIAPHILTRKENREDTGRALALLGRSLGDAADFRQIGTWLLIGMTGRWPMCIGIWELQSGWDTFAALVDRTMHAPDADLALVYERMQGIRTGGHTMILAPAPGSPTFEQATQSPGAGHLLILEEAWVEPGREDEYLAELDRAEGARLGDHGATSLGRYTGTAVEGQTIATWQASSEAFAAIRKEGPGRDWLQYARSVRTGWKQELWTAAPESRFSVLR